MDYETITFETFGGEQVAHLTRGEGATRANVVIAPALGIEARFYGRLSRSLSKAGIGSLPVDHIGFGASPVRASRDVDWGYPELVDHYRSACLALHEAEPDTPILLLGHSMGGHLALMTSGLEVPGLVGTVVVASGRSYWLDWRGVDALKMRILIPLCGRVARLLGWFPGDRVGFGGREARSVMTQWARSTRTRRFRFDDFDGEELIRRPGPPILGIRLEGDDWVPVLSMRRLLDKATSREVRFEVWPDAPFGGDHNRWPVKPGYLVGRLSAWLDQVVERG